jgi:hypothetical protein
VIVMVIMVVSTPNEIWICLYCLYLWILCIH